EQGVEGGFRFLNRVWRLAVDFMPSIKAVSPYSGSLEGLSESTKVLYQKTHETIKRVSRDIEERFHFNTAISAIMELVNVLQGIEAVPGDVESRQVVRFAMETTALLLSPIVPHFAEELWQQMGKRQPVTTMPWPTYREAALVQDELLIVVQVNGKVRSRFHIGADADKEQIRKAALADERAQSFIGGQPVKKVIVVKNKLVNIVV
ncbi:MAG: class I tRNA ligase family protein, partial [Deltaproteobacteria bacterium]